jgi:hypothetical protein
MVKSSILSSLFPFLLLLISAGLSRSNASSFTTKPIPLKDIPMNNREVQECLVSKQRTPRMYRFAFTRSAAGTSFEFAIPAYRLREFQLALLALSPAIGFTQFAEQVLDHGLVTIGLPASFPYRLASLRLPADLQAAPKTAYYGFYRRGDASGEIVMACALYARDGLPTRAVRYEAIPAIDYGDGMVTVDETDYQYMPPVAGNGGSMLMGLGLGGLVLALLLLAII